MGKQSKQAAYEQAKDRAVKAGICVADIVKIVKYDEDKMIVDVQPLTKYPDEEKFKKSHRYYLYLWLWFMAEVLSSVLCISQET